VRAAIGLLAEPDDVDDPSSPAFTANAGTRRLKDRHATNVIAQVPASGLKWTCLGRQLGALALSLVVPSG
jgi:hypothetical protein